MEPWMCPRCGIVWAGWVAKCTCAPVQYYTSDTTFDCPHLHTYETTAGRKCSKCGWTLPPFQSDNITVSET